MDVVEQVRLREKVRCLKEEVNHLRRLIALRDNKIVELHVKSNAIVSDALEADAKITAAKAIYKQELIKEKAILLNALRELQTDLKNGKDVMPLLSMIINGIEPQPGDHYSQPIK